jgi:hypothetical protein
MHVVTLWLAVDSSTRSNGCMRVIPRSHRRAFAEILPRRDTPNVLQSGIDPGLVPESQAVDLVLNPGDVSVHHPNIIHGSEPNNSDSRRCGLIIRYISTSVKILVPDGEVYPSAFLLRGSAAPGLNRYNPLPKYDAGRHMPFRGCLSGTYCGEQLSTKSALAPEQAEAESG